MFVLMWFSSRLDATHEIAENIATRLSFALSDHVTSEVFMSKTC